MSIQRRQFLRQVMTLAWSGWRNRWLKAPVETFAQALAAAWAHLKPRPAYNGPVTHLRLRSIVASPIRRSLTGQPYAFDRAYRAGRLTSRVGA